MENEAPEKKKTILEAVGVEVVVIGIIILIILGVLSYFNIIPVSTMLGWLPITNKSSPPKTITNSPKSNPTPEIATNNQVIPYISCPVSTEQCKNGKAIVEESNGKKNYGIKFSDLNKETSVSAAISGIKTKGDQNSVLITSSERGIELQYVWTGDFTQASTASSVTEKQIVGTFSSNVNTLTVYAISILAKESVKLGIGKDGQFLTNTGGQ